ncbi:MAG: polysaccharide biosynthesis C-terminal domain-containing protein, partial [Candidatus Accumulibacter sp.]|nr:polysaccharide biosynthesis C-terminal domain-containing protein [Accumulibacter sp.]
TLFQHGAFTASDALQTRSALTAYSFGLMGLMLVKVLAPGFYARQNVRTPVRIALVTLFATQALNFALVGWLKHAGLALSIGLSGYLNAALLYRGLRRNGSYTPQPGWAAFYAKLAAALAVMGTSLWWMGGDAESWLAPASAAERAIRLSQTVVLGASVSFSALWAAGFRLADFKRNAA